MKAGEVRRLAKSHTRAELEAARDAAFAQQPFPMEVKGEDDGERLTHVLLAIRLATAVEGGADFRTAFREIIGTVRTVLTDAEDD